MPRVSRRLRRAAVDHRQARAGVRRRAAGRRDDRPGADPPRRRPPARRTAARRDHGRHRRLVRPGRRAQGVRRRTRGDLSQGIRVVPGLVKWWSESRWETDNISASGGRLRADPGGPRRPQADQPPTKWATSRRGRIGGSRGEGMGSWGRTVGRWDGGTWDGGTVGRRDGGTGRLLRSHDRTSSPVSGCPVQAPRQPARPVPQGDEALCLGGRDVVEISRETQEDGESANDPMAMSRYRRNSRRPLFAAPSAMFNATEVAALLACALSPYTSCLGHAAVDRTTSSPSS